MIWVVTGRDGSVISVGAVWQILVSKETIITDIIMVDCENSSKICVPYHGLPKKVSRTVHGSF